MVKQLLDTWQQLKASNQDAVQAMAHSLA
jgi:hypothetical protein